MSWQALAEVILVIIITTNQLGAASRAISTAKSRATRANLPTWVAIVGSCLAVVIYMMIASSYQRSIMAAIIVTNPVTDLVFPTVTICPPRGVNTTPNHLLKKRFARNQKEVL